MLLIFMDLGMAIGSVVLGILAKYVDYGMTYGISSIAMLPSYSFISLLLEKKSVSNNRLPLFL